MNIKLLFTTIAALSLSTAALAKNDGGLFIEPGITYQVNSAELTYPAPFSNSEADANGLGLMARLGFHISESFFAGADARYSFHSMKDSTNNNDADAQSYNLAPVVGVQMPDLGLRVWAAYVLLGEMDPKATSNVDTKFTDANGFRIGAGFRIASISLNLEYEKLDYGTAHLESVGNFGVGASSSSFDLNSESYIASVSFPLEL